MSTTSRHRQVTGAALATAVAAGLVLFTTQSRASDNFNDIAVIVGAVNDALEYARTGAVLPWKNPETGSRGTIVIERTFYQPDETPCRNYVRQTDGPTPSLTRGTGCREQPGRWKLTESDPLSVEPSKKLTTAAGSTDEKAEVIEVSSAADPAETSSSTAPVPLPISKPELLSGSMPSRSY